MATVSFVVPAYNEQRYIGETLESIRVYAQDIEHEVIVVDHGSSDDTVSIARERNAYVYNASTGTVGMLRNIGVTHAKGEILVFIDADITLTQEWKDHFPSVIHKLTSHSHMVTGSQCEIPKAAHWISRSWFNTPRSERVTYIGTGHLVTTKNLFQSVGGFNPALATGEDYDFCMRARRAGAIIVAQPTLRVLHHGVPTGIGAFVRRERWHGLGDWVSIDAAVHSKVALATLLFALLHVTFVIGCVWFVAKGEAAVMTASLLGITSLCGVSAIRKYWRTGTGAVLLNTLVFYLYYWGRMLSLFMALRRRNNHKHSRHAQ